MIVKAIDEDMKEVFPNELEVKEVKRFSETDDIYKFKGVYGWFMEKDFEILEE